MAVLIIVISIGLAIQFYIDSRPNSQMNQVAEAVAKAIRETKEERHIT